MPATDDEMDDFDWSLRKYFRKDLIARGKWLGKDEERYRKEREAEERAYASLRAPVDWDAELRQLPRKPFDK